MKASQEFQTLPPPPGVIGSLKAGLDVIASHISIVLLPLVLDLWLWLGPRLSVKDIFTTLYSQMLTFYTSNGLPVTELQQGQAPLTDMLQQFNLFSFLRTFPVGVSSLMQGKMPASTPLGAEKVIEVGSWLSLFGWLLALTFLGWIVGAFYFQRVSRLVQQAGATTPTPRTIVQSLVFSLGFMIAAFILGLPVLMILSLLNLLGTAIMQAGLFVLMLFGSWLVVPLFFTPHGIFLGGQNAFRSVLSSLRLARFTLPSSSMFVLAIFLAAQGLNILWSVPPDDSWMLLVGIAGHAFITTALLAASFIYYRDMNAWLQTVFERMKSDVPRQAL